MIELNSKYGAVKIFAETIEEEAIGQITQMVNSPLGENAHTRIMPDCHAGAGCVIGTTMQITNKICPNLVGVDISCGLSLVKTDIDFISCLPELDQVIHERIPAGKAVHESEVQNLVNDDLKKMHCWPFLKKETQEKALLSLGTLGGGNHFIEAYKNGYIVVHSGSRNIGLNVAKYYQILAKKRFEEKYKKDYIEKLHSIPPREREDFAKSYRVQNSSIPEDLMWIEGEDMQNYLDDCKIINAWASQNRWSILETIVTAMGGHIFSRIETTHNYISKDKFGNIILRKGAIAAYERELVLIPLNMRDGLLICIGKENSDWNYSAPHGAGRLYSRSKAKEQISMEDYEKSMDGIYTTCVNQSTLDESPFAYKDAEEIMRLINSTVDIVEHLLPIYNFKAGE